MKNIILLLTLSSSGMAIAQKTEIPAGKPEIVHAHILGIPELTAGLIDFNDSQNLMSNLKKELTLSVVLNPTANNLVFCKVKSYKMTLIAKDGLREGTFFDDSTHWDYLFSKAKPGDLLLISDIKFYNSVNAVFEYCQNATFKLLE
jgi:hypothetical protein